MANTSHTTLTLTLPEAERIRVLSDGDLYEEALRFVKTHCADRYPNTAQVQGMVEYSIDWYSLNKFTSHQSSKPHHHDHDFYKALYKWLQDSRGRLESEWGLSISAPTTAESKLRRDWLCGLVAREFVQHVAAEIRYRTAVGGY